MRRSRQISKAGDFDTQVIVYEQSAVATSHTDGEIPETEHELCRRWAEIIPWASRSQKSLMELPGTTEGNVTHVVRMWYDSTTKTITPANWLETVTGGRRLNIMRAIDKENRHIVIELECTERVT